MQVNNLNGEKHKIWVANNTNAFNSKSKGPTITPSRKFKPKVVHQAHRIKHYTNPRMNKPAREMVSNQISTIKDPL
jgi:hypothetical protein